MTRSVALKVSPTSASEMAKAFLTSGITGKYRCTASGPIKVIDPSAAMKEMSDGRRKRFRA